MSSLILVFFKCTNSRIFGVQSLRDTIAIGIGIDADAAGVGIPASGFSVWYRRIPVSDWGKYVIPAFEKIAQRYEH
jgi:hypothetical protein